MPFINRAALGLPGLALLLVLAAGCGQNEGGRCQIQSDCASGLTCQNGGGTGNGRCERPGAGPVASDAAPRTDVAKPPLADANPDLTEASAEVEPDVAQLDSAAAEAGEPDGGALDTGESEAGGLDSM